MKISSRNCFRLGNHVNNVDANIDIRYVTSIGYICIGIFIGSDYTVYGYYTEVMYLSYKYPMQHNYLTKSKNWNRCFQDLLRLERDLMNKLYKIFPNNFFFIGRSYMYLWQ